MDVKQTLKIFFHGATPAQFKQIRLNPKGTIKWKSLCPNLNSVPFANLWNTEPEI